MGEYLSVGIVMAIKTNCNEELYLPQLKTEITEKIKMPIEDFEMMKDQDGNFSFYLPAKHFGNDLAEFLNNQNKMCNNSYGDISKILAKIANVKNLYELMELCAPTYNQLSPIFHLMVFEQYQINHNNNKILISIEALTFARDGKIMLEQGYWIFRYFEENIRLQSSPLAKYVRTNIS